MLILKRQVNSSSHFASFSIVMTHNSSVNFKLIHFLLWIKGSHQSPNFGTFQCFAIFPMSFSKTQVSFSSKFLSIFSVMKDNLSVLFMSNVIYFAQKEPIKARILIISCAQVKIQQILVIFETTNQFFFKFCTTLQCDERYLLYTILVEILYTCNKRSLSKYKFGEISHEQLNT